MCAEHPQGDVPETVLITIDIAEDGRVTRWTASSPDGQELEDWLAEGKLSTRSMRRKSKFCALTDRMPTSFRSYLPPAQTRRPLVAPR